MQASDLLLNATYDLAIDPLEGDLQVGLSDDQHVALLLRSSQGEWKQSPLSGVGIRQHQSGPMGPAQQATLLREIRIQLERDAYKVTTLQVNEAAELTIDAIRL